MIAQVDSVYIHMRTWKLWSRFIAYALFEGRPLTTKGRWINSLVFALFGIEKMLPASRKVRAPIFILGTGRSGTTVLGLVLSMHRDVGFLNEPKALWHSIHPEEDLIGNYSRGSAYYRLRAADATPESVRHAHRIFGAYLAASFSGRVVDKYPELIYRVEFVKALFPDARFLFLARNGWDTCASIENWSKRLGGQVGNEKHDWWGADNRKWNLLVDQIVPEHPDLAASLNEIVRLDNQSDMAAVEWVVTMREGLSLLSSNSDVMMVNYERMCSDPRTVLCEIASFCGLPDDDVYLKYGHEVLKPTKNRGPFELHPAVRGPFMATMRELGYEV